MENNLLKLWMADGNYPLIIIIIGICFHSKDRLDILSTNSSNKNYHPVREYLFDEG